MTPRILGALVLIAGCSLKTFGPPGSVDSGTTTSTGDDSTTAPASTSTTDTGDAVPSDCADLTSRVLQVFETNCAKCHGAGSQAAGGMDYILDLEQLIAREKILPGDPEGSRVYARMTAIESPMPPANEAQRPSSADIESVRAWISECSELSCSAKPFITQDEALAKINADLSTLPLEALEHTRYFTFVHLRNAGMCDADIEVHRQALSELVNALSQSTVIVRPEPIDADALILRIDLRDYAWDRPIRLTAPSHYFPDDAFVDDPEIPDGPVSEVEYADRWRMIAHQNPYTAAPKGQLADDIALLTGTDASAPAMLPGDAFIDAAVRAPLYYDILGVPRRSGRLHLEAAACVEQECLETALGRNIIADILVELNEDMSLVARAAMHASTVSNFNRMVERHRFSDDNDRVLWLTYDSAGQTGAQNVFAHPLDFAFDSVELLYTLPNGMPGFMLSDRAGTRLDAAPLAIVQDEGQDDFLVRAAVSCLGCHREGVVPAQDDLRWELDEGMLDVTFSATDKDNIRRLYPPREEFAALVEEDLANFAHAMDKSGVPPGGEQDPAATVFRLFAEPVDLRRAAAALGIPATDLRDRLGQLSGDLQGLGEDGGTVLRQSFTAHFAGIVCTLDLGSTRACP